MNSPQELGRSGEDLATDYLESEGYVIFERNYRFEKSELDIVCFLPDEDYTKGGEIVFVEVKTRSSDRYGAPEESIDDAKILSVIKASKAYLYEHKLEGSPARYDVISIVGLGSGTHRIKHFKDAFWAG